MCTHYQYPKERKVRRLLRYHRRRVFDPITGDAHERAIKRLKKTRTFVESTWNRHQRNMEHHLEVQWM